MRAIHFLLAIILIFNVISAQDSTNIEYDYEAKSNDWRFIISPYFWLAGQSTDVGGGKIRQSFNDLASLTNFGFQLSAGVLYKKWILSFDGTYANLGSNQEDLLLTLDLDIKQYMADIKLGYLVYSNISKEDGGVVRGWALEVNAGAKYWQNDIIVDYKIQIGNFEPFGQTIKENQNWWDVMLGAKARIFLSRSVLLGLTANAGGFGIGNSSDFSWDFTYVNTFKVSDLILVTAGYRTFRYNRTDGDGENELETSVSAFGPLLGVSFAF